MPIKNLTDRGAIFPRIGVLRKGDERPAQGNRPGADLTYFRFDCEDELARRAFHDAYGDEPRDINVHLPYQTTEENFQSWQEAWTASSLQHRCDGQTMQRWLLPDGKYSTEPRPCPGGCKPVGRLMVIVPELRRFAYVTVQTTSIHDIMELHGNLEAVAMLRGDLRGIPFVLKRRPREISTPRNDGKRARVTKWLLSIEAAPAWVGHQLQVMERAALPQMKALEDGRHVDTFTGEVVGDEADEAIEGETVDEPQTPPEAPPETKPLTPADRRKAESKLRNLWNEERELGEHLLTDLSEQQREMQLDIAELPDAELVALDQAVKARVQRLRTEEEEAATAVTT